MMYRKNVSINTTLSEKTAKLLVTLILVGISVMFTIAGVITLMVNRSNRNKCTEEVTAKVVDLLQHESTSSHNGRRHHSITYRPVFEYTYKGIEYVTESSVSTNPPAYGIGETVKLKIDPDNPKKILDPDSKIISLLGFIFSGVGVLLFIIYIIVMICIKRSEKKKALDNDNDYYAGDEIREYEYDKDQY